MKARGALLTKLMVREMRGKSFGDGTKLSNIHWLVDKTLNMCENYLTKTYLENLRSKFF